MKQQRRSPALIEIILIVGFMAIALTVVVQLFAEVFLQNSQIAQQSNAMVVMQDCAEQLKADPLGQPENVTLYYEEDFATRADGQTEHYIEVLVEPVAYEAGTLYNFTLTAFNQTDDGPEAIAQLTAARYVPNEGGAADE